jgi:hypothetical protein
MGLPRESSLLRLPRFDVDSRELRVDARWM